MKGIGIQLEGAGFIAVRAGVIQIGDTLTQNIYLILNGEKGDLKEYPLLGAAINDFICSEDIAAWKWSIIEELNRDNLNISSISIEDSNISITAEYEN